MSMRCPTCGTQFGDEAKFCTRDGTRLQAQGAPPASAPPPAAGIPLSGTTPRAMVPPVVPAKAFNPAALAGQVLEGRYTIVKKLGEGGMSYVYLGEDIATKDQYAIKVLSPQLVKDGNAMARLRREASLGMRLEHPNVCHIVRLGETEDGIVYVVMPFVQGEILSDRNNRKGQLPLDEVIPFVQQIAAGLQVAHELKIIHRDLKPENIMITRNPDGSEKAVVMDFGLAKERKAGGELEKLTATGIILGTPEFMSPEQLRGKPLDPRTDVYSLTLMTYEMLTGKLPFEGKNQQEMMIARLRNEPISIRTRRPDISEAVDKVLYKGMARNADDRYPTAMEFANELAAAAGGGGLMGRLFGR
ncbi:MAG: serine/threonine-protein kinase [Gemmatimonadota bacterium]|nr:serine/threonine-protein kinase [Gemmatimonadota bacterium]